MAGIRMNHITKTYDGDVTAVDDFNLDVEDKEFIVFVGPSGCGKSTTLRMIAGLEDITGGDLYIGDERVNDVSPKDRDIAMVFQNYALYPHMNVYNNMAFGLKLRKFKKDDIDQRVKNAADILGLTDYLDRKPKALSGGQRQRVALGRAIVRDPKVFLMDEPLSNLDAKLRVQMRTEIIKLHRRLNSTTVYVTHDQTEAMTMATRIVIMKDGVVQQVGSPKEVYDHPANVFVGGFIGSPAMNFLEGQINGTTLELGEHKLDIPESKMQILRDQGFENEKVTFGIRPEDIHHVMGGTTSSKNKLNLDIEVSEMNGAESILYTSVNGKQVIARVDANSSIHAGDKLDLFFNMDRCHFFNPDTEEVLTPELKELSATQ